MTRRLTLAFLGAIALGAASVGAGPVSAMPVGDVSQMVAAPADGHAVEKVRFQVRRGFHRGFVRRGRFFHRGFGYRRGFGYHRGFRVRRLLRRL